MDATIKKLPIRPQVEIGRGPNIVRPSREEAEEAVRTLILGIGAKETIEDIGWVFRSIEEGWTYVANQLEPKD